MTIALAEDMARSTTDISDELFGAMARAPVLFFGLGSLTLLSTNVQRLLLILILLFYLFILARELMNK